MRELVHFDNNHVSVSAAVVRVADALSPLATARDMVAIIGACVVEINQIDLERQKLAARQKSISQYLEQRQREVVAVFLEQQRIARYVEVDRSTIREVLSTVVRNSTDQYISEDERMMFANLIPVLSGQLVQAARDDHEGLVRLLEVLQISRYIRTVDRW